MNMLLITMDALFFIMVTYHTTNGQPEVLQKISLWINLTLPVLYISESCIEIKVKFLFSHFLVVLQKVWDTTKEYENKI